MFAVVEFINSENESTGEISVVPLMWLLKNQTKCYWPIRTNKVPFKQFVQSLTPFKKSWPIYRVKNHFTSATYEEAEQHLNGLITDNYESTDSTRTLVQKNILNDSDESIDSENSSPFKVPAISEASEELHMCNSPSSIAEGGVVKRVRLDFYKNDSPSHTPASKSSSVSDGGSSSQHTSGLSSSSMNAIHDTSSSRNSEFEKIVLSTLTQIAACVNQHSILLEEMNRRTSLTESDKLIPPDNLPDFPFYLLISFQEFESRLRNDLDFWTYMVRRLSSLGGSGTESHTRRILSYLLSNELARQFNWKGRDKLPFEKLKTKDLVLAAVKNAYPAKEIDEFKLSNVIKEWLKFASARLNKGKKSTND